MKTSKDEQVKRITDEILLSVKAAFDNHKRKVDKLNAQKSPVGLMRNEIAQNFYGPLAQIQQDLRKLQDQLKRSQKLRKERVQTWNKKLTILIEALETLRRNKHIIKIKINDYLIKLNSDTATCLEEASNHLRLFQKEASILCGKSYDYKPAVETSMINLCELSCLWSALGRFDSITNDSVNEIYLAAEFNEEEFRYIQNEIKNIWPEPEVQYVDKEIKVKDGSHLREAHEMLFGFTTPQNVQKAIEIYQQEQKKQNCHPKALMALGHLYEKGTYMKKDSSKAFSYYQQCAQMNDAEGLYKVGSFLEKGFVKSKDIFRGLYPNREAEVRGGIEYYEKAAKLGHLDAITDLGYIYEKGIPNEDGSGYFIEPTPQYAYKYYLKAKKSEFPRSYNNLGNLLITCSQLPEDVAGSNLEKGIRYLEKAVAMKYPKSYLNLGKCYQNGIGVLESADKARALYLDGAQQGDDQCKLSFVKCCLGNKIDDQETFMKMLELTRKILVEDSYNKEALYYMGLFLEQGIGVEANKQSSFFYIEAAAQMDYPPAITKLGDYYYSGYHVKKDTDYARALYERAATKGESNAIANRGVMFEKGISSENDPRRAQQLYEEAASMGNPHALIFLSNMKNGNIDQKEAITQAATLGSLQAMKMAKTSHIALPKKKHVASSYADTLKTMQSYYEKSYAYKSTLKQ